MNDNENGKDAPVAGISFVGTLPVFRRMGCLRKVHAKHFELLHEKDEINLLNNIYTQFIELRTGYLKREKYKWETGILNPPVDSGAVFDSVVYEENGTFSGYVIYTVEPDFSDKGPVHKITIKDMAWLSISAYYGIWNYFTKMDLTKNIHWRQAPPDDPLPHLLLEPAGLNIRSMRGLLARIIDL